jgi:hypothetical protein
VGDILFLSLRVELERVMVGSLEQRDDEVPLASKIGSSFACVRAAADLYQPRIAGADPIDEGISLDVGQIDLEFLATALK